MTAAEYSLTSCLWVCFWVGPHTMPGQQHSQPTLDFICMFRCNLPPALLAEWLGSFMCRCSNTGVEQIPNKSQHTKLMTEKKILPPLLPRFKLTTFWSQVQCSHQQLVGESIGLVIKRLWVSTAYTTESERDSLTYSPLPLTSPLPLHSTLLLPLTVREADVSFPPTRAV